MSDKRFVLRNSVEPEVVQFWLEMCDADVELVCEVPGCGKQYVACIRSNATLFIYTALPGSLGLKLDSLGRVEVVKAND